MKKNFLYVDIPSLYFCTNKKWYGQRLDYEKLLDYVHKQAPIFRAVAFGIYRDKPDAVRQSQAFINSLRKIGYEVTYQYELSQRTTCGISIFSELVRNAPHIDTLYLASSDPELVPVVEWARDNGIAVVIIGVNIGRALRNIAHQTIDIDEALLTAAE